MNERTLPLRETSIPSLPLVGRGKVRDIYAVGADRLLLVATDRISAFDVIMTEPIPNKGAILTRMSLFWFDLLSTLVPNHLTGQQPEDIVLDDEKHQIIGRSLLVKRLRPIPIEAVVRGYLAGSAWVAYKHYGSVFGTPLPADIRLAAPLPYPIFTPTTKSPHGGHDQNITHTEAERIIGTELFSRIKNISIDLYKKAAALALSKGIIIADTKFEFGLDESEKLILMDEVLTPDSSRFWPLESYIEGQNPPSFDKQFVRDWLESVNIDGKPWDKTSPAPTLPPEVIAATSVKYREALSRIVG